jgi:chitodextrinase
MTTFNSSTARAMRVAFSTGSVFSPSALAKCIGLSLLSLLLTILAGAPAARAQAQISAFNVPVTGEIQRLTLNDANDVWSGGTIVVGGQNVTLPRNLLLDLPANRLTLQQLFAQAPAACASRGESGIAKADRCNTTGAGGIATLTAIRTVGGNIIAADVYLQKGVEVVSGVVTYINYADGYFRMNGNMNDANTGVVVRFNDPTGRYTVQQGLGCVAGSPNCSADARFTGDPDNYTHAFGTGYPSCLPSTVPRQFADKLDLNRNGNKSEILTAASAADGTGDLLCPATNRTTPGTAPLLVDSAIQLVDDSRRFAPIVIGDHVIAKGNFESVGSTQFLSAWNTVTSGRLETKEAPGQPDYMTITEMFVETPGFQAQRARSTIMGWTTLDSASATGAQGSDVLFWSVHRDPGNNRGHEFPFGSVRGCDNAAGKGRCTGNEGAPDAFRLRYIIGFAPPAPFAKKPEDSACNVLRAESRLNVPGKNLCPSVDTTGTPSLEDEMGIISPIMHEMQARTGRKLADLQRGSGETLFTIDVRGNDAPNGQYLFPMGINLGGIAPPELGELNPGLLGTPFNVSGFPWNLDRRLSPNGCIGPCETTPQPLDPFPFEGVDPRLQAFNTLTAGVSLPTGNYTDLNFTRNPLTNASDRMLSFVSPVFGIFDGDNTLLAWPPLDPSPSPIFATNTFTPAPRTCDIVAPSAPTGLTATGISATGINLTWSAPADNIAVANFLVFRDGIAMPIATVVGTSFTVGGLAPLTTHTFNVVAIDASGNMSVSSNVATGRTLADTSAPTSPVGLLATASGSTVINLTWLPSTDNVRVAAYQVFRDGGTSAVANVVGTSFTDTGLAPGSTHSYKVAAFDAANNQSPLTGAATATTANPTAPGATDAVAPTAPAGLVATGVSATQISLFWNASTDNVGVAGYLVYRDSASLAIATVTTGTTYTDSLLAAGTAHTYKVQAYDAAGNLSAQSTPASASTQALGVVNSLTLSVTSVRAGVQPFPVGTVTISNFAPTSGTVVNLTSSASGLATVPTTVVVPPGQRTATFTITTSTASGIALPSSAVITASINGTGQSATLNVIP